ncbi:single-stranded DNA-binding protein [Streptomyces sp. NPDC000594]|uniref:single-stranded DNA-binding protein n=1 Tax=Streptomyces sp. NPDC000594 TaxID=3154261 RepID=UPI00331F4615
MNDAMVTLVGNAATPVEYRETATGGMVRFRLAVTPRRWDRRQERWADGPTGFYTVFAWRNLARNLAGSVTVGEPLLVHGRLRVRESEPEGRQAPHDGDHPRAARRAFVDVEAVAVGHDLNRGTSAFRRPPRERPGGAEPSGEPVEEAVTWSSPPADPAVAAAAGDARPGKSPVGAGDDAVMEFAHEGAGGAVAASEARAGALVPNAAGEAVDYLKPPF